MAKLSNMTLTSSVDGTEPVPIVQSSTNKRTLISTIGDWILARDVISVRSQGAIGNGTTDDNAAITTAIATGKSLYWGGSDKTYRITSKVTFNQANQHNYGHGATLLFDGANTTKLFDVTANDVQFHGLVFNGNAKQPSGALTYVASNALRPKFIDCTWRNMSGSATGSTLLNNMYGLLISPYGVKNFEVRGCTFRDFLKYNTTAVVTTPTEGWGYTGGIMFLTDDFAEPTTAVTTPTTGVIDDCAFDDIQTALDGSLSEADRITYDDADGIRFYGDATLAGVTFLGVKVTNCTFKKVSKRAIKQSISFGQIIENIHVDGSGMDYGMVSVIKLDNGTTARDIKFNTTSDKRVIQGFQIQGYQNITLNGARIDYCETAVAFVPGSANYTITNVTVRDVLAVNCTEYGYRQSAPQVVSQSGISLEESQFYGTNTTMIGIENIAATDGTGGFSIKNCYTNDGRVKIAGTGNRIDGLEMEIDSATYDPASNRSIFEVSGGTRTAPTVMNNVFLNAHNLLTTFTSASRQYVGIIQGVYSLTKFRMKVPEALSTTYRHLYMNGTDITVDGLEYDGPGAIDFGVGLSIIRGTLKNATRLGDDASTDVFIRSSHASNSLITMENITDFRPTSAQSIAISGGASNYVVSGVRSKSSAVSIITHGTRATVSNVSDFSGGAPTVVAATTITLPNGHRVVEVTGNTEIANITASEDWQNQPVGLLFTGTPTVKDGTGNIKLPADFVASADDILWVVLYGSTWYGMGSSAN